MTDDIAAQYEGRIRAWKNGFRLGCLAGIALTVAVFLADRLL